MIQNQSLSTRIFVSWEGWRLATFLQALVLSSFLTIWGPSFYPQTVLLLLFSILTKILKIIHVCVFTSSDHVLISDLCKPSSSPQPCYSPCSGHQSRVQFSVHLLSSPWCLMMLISPFQNLPPLTFPTLSYSPLTLWLLIILSPLQISLL